MTDAQFYKGFVFRRFEYNRYHTTNCITGSGSPYHYFAKMITGCARLQTENYTVELQAGDVFYIPCGIRYRSHWYPVDGTVSFYSFGFSHLPSSVDYKVQKINCENNPNLDALCELTVSARAVAALYAFFADVQDMMVPRCNRPLDTVSAMAVDIMRKSPGISVKDIAKACGISESGLYSLFRRKLGKTPLEVRRGITVERAVTQLVTTDMSVEEISRSLGFSSSSYFRKVVARQTGLTPSAIRKHGI